MKTFFAVFAFALSFGSSWAADPGGAVTLDWLGGEGTAAPAAVNWGVPWAKGQVQRTDALVLRGSDGAAIPMQTWPMAYWPDGSVKWSGHAIAFATAPKGPLTIARGTAASAGQPAATLKVSDMPAAFEIDTGVLRARIPKSGADLIETLAIGGRVVGQKGRLIALREDRSAYEAEGVIREEQFVSELKAVMIEQSGPVRAVVKLEGMHKAVRGSSRAWLPFTVRLYFYADSAAVRLVHSFVFDGDGNKDFLKGIGLTFSVPFKEELQNRHMRFVGDGEGVWTQPVLMLPGYRAQAGRAIGEHYASHLAGQRVPNLDGFDRTTRANIVTVPKWGDAKIVQNGPNSFSLFKRTTAESSWLHYNDGRRARGLAVFGDVSGGLAVGVKDFWQKHPASIELTGGATAAGEIKIWLWSPEGGAMDLRHYDTVPHGLPINYEDWKPGWSTPLGIANTADITLWAFSAIPSNAQLVAMAGVASEPPTLVCTPAYYHSLQVFGHWSLPDRSTPTLDWVENQVGGLVDYYRQQVEERSWYGFWNYGDIMHNYDFGRHDWRYDVGGWAWVNTELMPDMLLWYTFLRTGRKDIFRMAEAMTRHTSEVDVHHIGPFAPLGSRHNVSHWGDGAKQPRISHVGLKQFYYFLTTDERTGDLMREQLTADRTYELLQKYNAAHYTLPEDGIPVLANPGGVAAPRPENFPPLSEAGAGPARVGLEWMCYAMNWMMEWQRTGDVQWRDRVLRDMKAMSAGLNENGRLPGRYFDMIFGGPENLYEMEPMFDVPEFWRAWANTSEDVGRQVNGGQMTGPRMLAYAAYRKKDAELGRLAWERLIGLKLPPPARPTPVSGPNVVRPVTDPVFLGNEVGWQLHGVASIQWALNAIETLEFAKEYLPVWEAWVRTNPTATPVAPQPPGPGGGPPRRP